MFWKKKKTSEEKPSTGNESTHGKSSKFGASRLADRSVDELLGLCQGILADGKVDQSEAEFLYKWMINNKGRISSPVIKNLFGRLQEMLSDNVLDDEESAELLQTLTDLTGANYEVGEVQKSSNLPLDQPQPEIHFKDSRFLFTGTFAYGKRTECIEATEQLGGIAIKQVTKKLNYLVVGQYCTDAWIHSSYGRKIEKALEYKENLPEIKIVSEENWRSYLQK